MRKLRALGVLVVVAVVGLCAYLYPALREHPLVLLFAGLAGTALWLWWMLFRNPLGRRGP